MLLEFFASMNVQTTLFLLSVAILVQACFIAVQAVLVREYRGIRTSALANLGIALGIFLISLRGFLSDLLTVIVGNYVQMVGIALLYVAICRFIGVRHNKAVIAIALLPTLLLFPYYTFVDNNLSVRILLVNFGGALLLGMMAFRLHGVRQEAYRFTARLLKVTLGVYAFVLIFRSVDVVLSPPQSLFDSNIHFFHALTLFVTSYLWTSVFSLMVSQRLQGDLTDLVTVDSLTRVTNRRGMLQILEAEFARKSRTSHDFSVLLVDVDHFKSINDRYGHMTGDEVLHSLAQLMRQTIRTQDFIARWGGEEFLILLPATRPLEAMYIGERLRTAVEQGKFLHDGEDLPLTISVGVGNSSSCPDLDKIYRCADSALYKAKLTRNAVAQNEMRLN